MVSNIAGRISRYFELETYGTTITTEVLAGIATYLSLVYIFLVNPAILSQAGIDAKAALFATAASAALATLAMGLWARLPFAVAPGMTMNSYFTFIVCQKLGLTWQQGLATVFVSGIICVILTALPIRQAIVDSIPRGLKKAITVTIGVFMATIGLFIAKVLVFTPTGLIDIDAMGIGNFTSPLAMVLALGLVVSAVLGMKRLRFPAGMIVAIILAAILYHRIMPPSDAPLPSSSEGSVLATFMQMDFSVFFHSEFWVPVIVFFVLNFFEGIGQFIGLTSNTSIQDKNGNVRNMKQGLWVDGLGTVGGAMLGTSSLIIFVESAVGIKAGGRTGLTSVVCAILMALGVWGSFYFAPLLTLVPSQAAAGVLVYVGYLILSSALGSREDGGFSRFDIAVTLAMGAISLLTFSLDKSLAFGLWAYFGLSLMPGRGQKPSLWLAGIAALLTLAIVCSQ
ncbi:hypothetical protein GC177_06320 [bacterium]|nr:hypothetical protein [bacterium]